MPGISDDCEPKKTFLFFGHKLLEKLEPCVLNHDSILQTEDKLRAKFSVIPGRQSERFFDAHSTGFSDMKKGDFMIVEDWHIMRLLVRKIL